MNQRKLISTGCLLLAAMIWGLAFVAQDFAAEQVQPFTLNAARSFIAALVLLPVSFGARKLQKRAWRETKADRALLLRSGVICGVCLCVAVNFQQFGIAMYPKDAAASGRAGFLTALYILFVPLFGLFFKKKPGVNVLIGVALAIGGLYLLCLSGGLNAIYQGDWILLICAAAFAVQIMAVDRCIDRVDPIKLSCIQFFITGVLSTILMFIFEQPTLEVILEAWAPILYLGVMSSGIAYTLQIIGQKHSDSPTVSSILMSMESVFAVIGGALFGDRMTPRELIGCGVMLLAIIVAQLPTQWFKKNKKSLS